MLRNHRTVALVVVPLLLAAAIVDHDGISIGLSVVALSYPNGDYTSREIKFASDAGYTCGLTVDLGFNSDRTHPYRLRRISIDDEDDVSTLVVKASGLWGLAKRFVAKPDHGYTDSPPIDG